MSGHHIDFVALDFARKGDGGLPIDDPLAELLDHRLDISLVHVEFLGDLQTRQVQAHEVQTNDPDLQGFVMAGEDRAGQVVEPATAAVTEVTLPMGFGVIPAVLDDREGRTVRASHTVGPAHRANGFIALGVVDKIPDVHHRSVP